MKRKFLKQVVEYLLTLFIVLTLNFFIPRLMPGDPFIFLSSDEGQISITYSDNQIEKYKAYYGLDKPVIVQYLNYISNLVKGNIGYSIYYNDSVIKVIGKRMLWTLCIVILAIILSCVVGTVLGSVSAWNRNGIADKLLYALMMVFSEIPAFLVGIFLLFLLAGNLGWFPLSGGMKSFASYDNFAERVLDILYHAFLPALTLSIVRLGDFYLLARSSMISVLTKDYMRTARGKGLGKLKIIFRHALKNALLPILTRVFLSLGTLFGGALLVENVFNYPGIGRLMREAVMVRDYVLIQGIFLFVAFAVLTMNLFADIIYRSLDPRVRENK